MENTYWNSKGTHQALANELNKLIPTVGEIKGSKNKALEKFRKASNVYYDVFNNGLCNRGRAFTGIFKFNASNYKLARYTKWGLVREIDFNRIIVPMDKVMDEIILAAAKEQGIA